MLFFTFLIVPFQWMNMLTSLDLQLQSHQGSCGAMGSPCVVRRRYTLGRHDSHLPLGKPQPRHPLVGRLHTWRPTAKPGGQLSSYCWGHNPFSPVLYLVKAVHGKCQESRKTFSHFTLISQCCLQRQKVTDSSFRKPVFWTMEFLR